MDRWLSFFAHALVAGILLTASTSTTQVVVATTVEEETLLLLNKKDGQSGRILQNNDACRGINEVKQHGHIYMEVEGRPADVENAHYHALENAMLSFYYSGSSHLCDDNAGYRHLTGAKIDRGIIPSSSTKRQKFLMDFEVSGACKGCSSNTNFFSSNGGRYLLRRDKELQQMLKDDDTNLDRKLSSKKSSKRSSKKSSSGSRSRSTSKKNNRHHVAVKSSSCSCPAQPSDWIMMAFQHITEDVLEILRVHEDESVAKEFKARQKDEEDSEAKDAKHSATAWSMDETDEPTLEPTMEADTTLAPTTAAKLEPTTSPVSEPTLLEEPSSSPVGVPTQVEPSTSPVDVPTQVEPSTSPVSVPTVKPSLRPSMPQTEMTSEPTTATTSPVGEPTTDSKPPVSVPTLKPSLRPTANPTKEPTSAPSLAPTSGGYCGPTPAPITYRSPNCDKGSQPGYQICLEMLNMPCEDAPLFDASVQFWENAISNDLSDHFIDPQLLTNPQFCGNGFSPPRPVDDLYICGKFSKIDGNSNVLGTGTSVQETQDPAPIKWGILNIDVDDVAWLQADNARYYDVITHEMVSTLMVLKILNLSVVRISHSFKTFLFSAGSCPGNWQQLANAGQKTCKL